MHCEVYVVIGLDENFKKTLDIVLKIVHAQKQIVRICTPYNSFDVNFVMYHT